MVEENRAEIFPPKLIFADFWSFIFFLWILYEWSEKKLLIFLVESVSSIVYMYARDSHQSRLLTELQFKRSLIECTKRTYEKANISADTPIQLFACSHTHIHTSSQQTWIHKVYIEIWVLLYRHTVQMGKRERVSDSVRLWNENYMQIARLNMRIPRRANDTYIHTYMRMAKSKRNANKRVWMVYGAAYNNHLYTLPHNMHIC